MNVQKNKFLTIALILTLTLNVIIATLPNAAAQEPPTKKTFAFINAVPNPVGVDQQVLLHVGILTPLTYKHGWKDLKVTIQKPDGAEMELGPQDTDPTGGTGIVFTPEQVGTYKLRSHFPEQECPVTYFAFESGNIILEGTIMEESYSDWLELEVQEDPLPDYPATPLPEEYWTRPIDSQHYHWYRISANWPSSPDNFLAPYNEYAPETAHILWTKTLSTGGLVGGKYGYHAYHDGDAYEGEWGGGWGGGGPVIMNGILYYNENPYHMSYGGQLYPPGFVAYPGTRAVDLHTGEELWFNPDLRINFGQIYYYSSLNQHGARCYLWSTSGSTWEAYDPYNGNWRFTIENVSSSGNQYYGKNGEIMILNVDTHNNRMTLWNNTAIPELTGGTGGTSEAMWRPYSKTVDGRKGYQWNVSIPTGLGSPGGASQGMSYKVYDDRAIGISRNQSIVTVWGLSLNKTDRGERIFKKTWQPPAEWEESNLIIGYAGATEEVKDGVIALWCKEQRRYYGFSTENGEHMWTTDSEQYLQSYVGTNRAFANGRLYSTGVSGRLYCYDLTDGKLLWTHNAADPYNEILWANNWWQMILFITDGKLYMAHSEHSAVDPKPRGSPFICLNATTGDVIWRADGLFRQTHWGAQAIMGDSIIATMDTYDMRIYAIGKGSSQTTVTAPDTGVSQGSSVTIKGTVMDNSPGVKDYEQTSRFPNGVPCVADEDMSEWMKYVYKQFPCPDDVTGVPVSIDVMTPNGETEHIATVTSDGFGFYSYQWTPPEEGKYTITATFGSSEGYYPSYAETAVSVDPAPPETVSPTEQPAWYEEPPATVSPTEQPEWYEEPASPTEQPEWYQKPPAYTTVDLVLIAAVIVVAILVVYDIFVNRRQK